MAARLRGAVAGSNARKASGEVQVARIETVAVHRGERRTKPKGLDPVAGVLARQVRRDGRRESALMTNSGLVSLIDNTLATPVNFRPTATGFDLSRHRATKYLNGHSDIVAGATVVQAERVERARNTSNHFGGSLDPHAGFVLARGVNTLALKVLTQHENALALAEFLAARKEISAGSGPSADRRGATPLRHTKSRRSGVLDHAPGGHVARRNEPSRPGIPGHHRRPGPGQRGHREPRRPDRRLRPSPEEPLTPATGP